MTRASDTARLLGAGATILDGTTISTADNDPQLILTSTDADGNEGPVLKLLRNSASPADDDNGGRVQFTGKNDAGQDVEYARVRFNIQDVTDGEEDGQMDIATMIAGSLQNRIFINDTGIVFNDGSIDSDFRVESNGNANMLTVNGGSNLVGIGADPDLGAGLHVKLSDSGAGVSSTYDTVVIEESGHSGIQILSGTSSTGLLGFNDSGAALRGYIAYAHASDNMEFGTGGSERVRIDSTGRLFRGSTTDLTGICQSFFKNIHQGEGGIGIGNNDGANTTNAMIFRNSNGNIGSIQTSSSSTIFNTSSDYRLKENVDYNFDATTRLKQLKPSRFNFIAEPNITVDGFLAHEVSSIVPEAISGEKDDTKDRTNVVLSSTNVVIGFNVTEEEWTKGKTDGIYASNTTWSSTHTEIVAQQIDQSKLVPLLVKTIQELEARITTLENA